MRKDAPAVMLRLLKNRNFLLVLALILGITIGKPGASLIQPAVLPLLALVMVLATLNISTREFTDIKKVSRIVLYSLLLNYVVLGGITLLLARGLIADYELWVGFVVLSLTPAATAIVPFSYALAGDVCFSVIGMTATYLAGLIIMPLGMFYIIGAQGFNQLSLLLILIELIILPIIIARILSRLDLTRYIEPHRGSIVNWALFFVIFTIIGLNSQVFINDFNVLIVTSIIAVATSFLLAYLLEFGTKVLRVKHKTSVSVILMGTYKNWSLAGGLLLSLFSERSVIPPAVCVFYATFMIVWLGYRFRKQHPGHIIRTLI
jgi:predicted Na+-dependent transporter